MAAGPRAARRAGRGRRELWYWRWDRFERAYDARRAPRARLAACHERPRERADLTIAASDELAELEREAGRDAELVPLAADSSRRPTRAATVVAVSLGHLGRRTDWALLRAVSERMPELVLLLVGAWHEEEVRGDEDYACCRAAPNLVWLGRAHDEEAARLILCADVGIVPFKVEPFNDAGLPYRILKYARLGRRTVAPALAGVRTWSRGGDRRRRRRGLRRRAARRGRRPRATRTPELREWALAQTARAPERAAVGAAARSSGSSARIRTGADVGAEAPRAHDRREARVRARW